MWSADVYFLAALLGLDRDELFRLPVRWPPPSIASAPAAAVSRSCEAIPQYFSIDKNGFFKKRELVGTARHPRWIESALWSWPSLHDQAKQTNVTWRRRWRPVTYGNSRIRAKLNVLPHTRRLRNLFWPRRVIWLYSRWASFHPLCPLVRKQMKEPLL